MHEIQLGKRVFKAPACWAECGEGQVEKLILFSLVKEPPPMLWVETIRTLMGWGNKYMRGLVLSSDQFEELKQLFGWVFSERSDTFPSASFRHCGVEYFFPDDGFDNSTAEELSLGAMYFTNLANLDGGTDEGHNLEQLIAVFCRPERPKREQGATGYDGDVRERYSEHASLRRAELFQGLTMHRKVLFLHWFESHFTVFLENYAAVFGGQKKEARRYPDGRGWQMLLKNVAKQGYLGDLEKVGRTNVHVVWSYLLDDVLDQKDLKNADT